MQSITLQRHLSAWLDSNQRWIIGFADQWLQPLTHRCIFVEIRRFELLLPESKSRVLNHYTISQYQAGREGFEPSEEFTSAVLETAALNHSATDLYIFILYFKDLVPMIGFEPMTYRIWVCCSCQLSYISIWSRVRELNPHYFSLEGRCHTIRRTLHLCG